MTLDDEHLSPGDVALSLHCSVRHAGELMRREMGAIDIGLGKVPRWRVSRENFEAWQERKGATARMAFGSAGQRGGRTSPGSGFLRAVKTARLRATSGPNSSEKPRVRHTQPRSVPRSQT